MIRAKAYKLLLITLIYTLFALHAGIARAADILEFDGLIEPHLVVDVGSSVAGVLKSVTVDRGDMVEKGQVLARLESGVEKATMELARTRSEMEATVMARRKELAFARWNEQRVKKLLSQKVIPEREWDDIETKRILAEYRLAEALENKRLAQMELKRATEVVKETIIHSTVTGIVVERFLTTGEYVEDHPILKLAQIHPLNVEVILPVQIFGAIKVNMLAAVKPEEPVGGSYKAKVKIVDKFIEAASGTFRIRLELPNPDHRLPFGLKCKVVFQNVLPKKGVSSKKGVPSKKEVSSKKDVPPKKEVSSKKDVPSKKEISLKKGVSYKIEDSSKKGQIYKGKIISKKSVPSEKRITPTEKKMSSSE